MVAGCKNQAANIQSSPSISGRSSISSSSAVSNESSSERSSSGNDSSDLNQSKVYFGSWVIEKYISTGAVEGFSKSSANDYVGEKITVNADSIKTDDGTVDNPEFKEATLTNTDFYNDRKIFFSNAGITGDSVTEVKVSNYNINSGTEDRIGSNFIVTNDNQVYTFIAGALFKLSKQ